LKEQSSNFNVLSDKNFFHELCECIFGVDKFLFNNICSYHNIVKTSVLKVIELNTSPSLIDNSLIKAEVCYFKNLLKEGTAANLTIKQRKKLKLEYGIRRKM